MNRDYGRWTYGDAGDRWPVQPGQVWACGVHRLACADLQQDAGHVLAQLAEGEADACYVDPPWNAGNARAFRTKAAAPGAVSWPTFLASLADAVRIAPQIFVEFGLREHQVVVDAMDAHGAVLVDVWEGTYYRKHPCMLMHFGPRPLPNREALEGKDDEQWPRLALEGLQLRPHASVIDPCTGRGLTAVTAHLLGCHFTGTELHPRRMAVALDKLHKLGAGTPRLVTTTRELTHGG